MIRKDLVIVLFLSLILGNLVFAQDDSLQSTVDYKVNKMKRELKLTDSQANAIDPIIKDYMVKRQAFIDQVAGQGVVDHVAVRGTLKELKETEYQKLGKILSKDQMKDWVNKENLMASLNPDGVDSTVDEGPSLNGNGVDLKF